MDFFYSTVNGFCESTLAITLTDFSFVELSRCEYVLAVVFQLECPK